MSKTCGGSILPQRLPEIGNTDSEIMNSPYYGAIDGFEIAFQQLTNFSKGFIGKVLEQQLAPE